MPIHPYPSANRLRHLTTYLPDTGELLWNSRISEDFAIPMPDRQVKRWNTRFAGAPAFGFDGQRSRYPNGYLDGHSIAKHRAIWAVHYGEWPDRQIDHINRDVLDNRISNLRQCTATENLRNRGIMRSNTTGVTGVYFDKHSRWVARIGENGKHKVLGRFELFEDAVAARKKAEDEMGYGAKSALSDAVGYDVLAFLNE